MQSLPSSQVDKIVRAKFERECSKAVLKIYSLRSYLESFSSGNRTYPNLGTIPDLCERTRQRVCLGSFSTADIWARGHLIDKVYQKRCPACKEDDAETLEHILLDCEAYAHIHARLKIGWNTVPADRQRSLLTKKKVPCEAFLLVLLGGTSGFELTTVERRLFRSAYDTEALSSLLRMRLGILSKLREDHSRTCMRRIPLLANPIRDDVSCRRDSVS